MHIPCRIITVWPALLFLLALGTSNGSPATKSPGTTKNLKQIVVGRCLDYRRSDNRNKGVLPRVVASCLAIWKSFREAFWYKSPRSVTIKNYDQYLNLTHQKIPENKTLLYSNIFTIANRYSQKGRRLVTLEVTLMGHLLDSLRWCGKKSAFGIDYQRCPGDAVSNFWAAASIKFAKQARGVVTVLLNGSSPVRPAYYHKSFFVTYELPNINPARVHLLRLLVIHQFDKPIRDTCNDGSVVDLIQYAQSRDLKVSCEDDPKSVLFLLCSDDPDSQHCQLAKDHMGMSNS